MVLICYTNTIIYILIVITIIISAFGIMISNLLGLGVIICTMYKLVIPNTRMTGYL